MGNSNSLLNIKKYNFEDLQLARQSNGNVIIINTLDESLQECIIPGTINIQDEVKLLNQQLNKDKSVTIVVYGKNHNDEKIISKYKQLTSLGFSNIFIYPGGIFEWLLLQEIYGDDNFPTSIKEIDILKYR